MEEWEEDGPLLPRSHPASITMGPGLPWAQWQASRVVTVTGSRVEWAWLWSLVGAQTLGSAASVDPPLIN